LVVGPWSLANQCARRDFFAPFAAVFAPFAAVFAPFAAVFAPFAAVFAPFAVKSFAVN
jgi:hypothetical protein